MGSLRIGEHPSCPLARDQEDLALAHISAEATQSGFVVRRSTGLAWLDEPGHAHRDATVDFRTHPPCLRGLADAIGPLACEHRVSRRRQVG